MVSAAVLDITWTAPTTNTDGSELTDLVAYRVYYATGASPCPGSTFVQVASSTSNPDLAQTVSVRLTGLIAGTRYNVSVTAINSSGNQSPCSVVASATASPAVSVTPTGTVSFGSVNVGGVADRAFTLQNTRAGSVSGTASASGPFQVVSGNPFTIPGSGTAQVTVRFAPTAAATSTANVTFSSEGDSISRPVTGTGLVLDTTPPTVTITQPTTGSTFTTTSSSLTFGGAASDNVGVTQVTWVNNRGGGGTASGTSVWTADVSGLQIGPNILKVMARDSANLTSSRSLTVIVMPAFTFTDDPVVAQITTVRTAHFAELRAAIDAVRAARGLAAFPWTDPTLIPGSSVPRALHLFELRMALNQAYSAAGKPVPTYTDEPLEPGATIRAIHVNEIRAAVRAL